MQTFTLDNVLDSHIEALIEAGADPINGAANNGITDWILAVADATKSKDALVHEVVRETDKAWKVNMTMNGRGLARNLADVTITTWIPKSRVSMTTDGFDTVALIPNWLARKIVKEFWA